MYGYVYLTKNTANGRLYVGSHASNIFDKKYYGSGKYLLRALKKYGAEKFKCRILYKAKSNKQLLDVETYFIEKLLKKHGGNAYNIALVAGSPMRGRRHTEETKKKYSETRRGVNNPMYGVRLLGEKNGNFGKHHTAETKAIIGQKNRLIRGDAHGNWKAIRSQETRKRISNSKRGAMTSRSKNDILNELLLQKNKIYSDLPSWAKNIINNYRSGIWQKNQTASKNIYRLCEFINALDSVDILTKEYASNKFYYRGA